MDLTNLKLFQMAAKRMDWLSKRQQVLSQNIANSDTPSYAAQDLKDLSFRDLMRRNRTLPTLEKTSPLHIAATRTTPKFRPEKEREPYEMAPGGNAVVLEEQLTKVSETQANYRLATNIYAKHVTLIRMALGTPSR